MTEQKQKGWLSKKFTDMSMKAGMKAVAAFIPTLKNLAKMAEPKMLRYFQGFNEEDGTQTEERIVVMKLTKDKQRVMVNIIKAPKMQFQFKPNAIEEVHDATQWLQMFVTGQLDKEIDHVNLKELE